MRDKLLKILRMIDNQILTPEKALKEILYLIFIESILPDCCKKKAG